mgnify:CR=1 FL=1
MCFIPRNEILQLGYLLLLLSIRSLKLGFLHRIHLLELVIVAYISVKLAILHMVYNIDNRIQERNIMGYKYKRILVFLKVSLQPLYMVCIKVIRRLVKQKYLRLLKQKLCQKNLGSLSARQLRHILVKAELQQVKCPGNLLNF